MDQEARESDESCSLVTSEVDSWEYSEEEEQDGEDDKAFFERLENMMDVLNVEDGNSVSESDDAHDEDDAQAYQMCRSGRTIRALKRLIEEMNALSVKKEIERPKWNDCLGELYDGIYEKALVGAGIGGGFVHSSELNVKNYNKAMKSADMDELSKWIKGMDEEHAWFLFNEVWTAVLRENYKDVMPITMTWALKLKANGVVRARCNVRGFGQIPNVHYDPNSKSSPVTTQAAIFIAFTILMMNRRYVARVIDVKGAFLKGKFASEGKKLMLEVPQGFCWIYSKLGDEVEARQKGGQAMLSEEVMKRAKEIFGEWSAKPVGEKLRLL
jgi:Reverse transcriptase (RNA-dependent DNA polymerase)